MQSIINIYKQDKIHNHTKGFTESFNAFIDDIEILTPQEVIVEGIEDADMLTV